MDWEKIGQDFEAQCQNTEEINEQEHVEATEIIIAESKEDTALMEQTKVAEKNFGTVVGGVQGKILEEATKQISSEKIVNKHAENLKNIADKALEVQAEQASLHVQEQEADNKVRKQEIKNKLIVLKAEAQRLEKEQKQLNKEQKADHKRRNKEAKWELYKDKLTKMKYTYVPCAFVLAMLLFFDGVKSFFDGLGTVNTAIVKALKWVILIGIILIVLFSIPVTNEWITKFLSGG